MTSDDELYEYYDYLECRFCGGPVDEDQAEEFGGRHAACLDEALQGLPQEASYYRPAEEEP